MKLYSEGICGQGIEVEQRNMFQDALLKLLWMAIEEQCIMFFQYFKLILDERNMLDNLGNQWTQKMLVFLSELISYKIS